MSNYIVTDTELTSIANAIRTQNSSNSSLIFPNGFVSAINQLGSGGNSNIPSATITFNIVETSSGVIDDSTITIASTSFDYPILAVPGVVVEEGDNYTYTLQVDWVVEDCTITIPIFYSEAKWYPYVEFLGDDDAYFGRCNSIVSISGDIETATDEYSNTYYSITGDCSITLTYDENVGGQE